MAYFGPVLLAALALRSQRLMTAERRLGRTRERKATLFL